MTWPIALRMMATLQSGEIGKLGCMFGDPVPSALFDGDGLARLLFQLLAIMLDLADLLHQARAEQRVFIDEGDAHQITVILASTPGDDPVIARLIDEQRNAQPHRGATAKGT